MLKVFVGVYKKIVCEEAVLLIRECRIYRNSVFADIPRGSAKTNPGVPMRALGKSEIEKKTLVSAKTLDLNWQAP